MKNSSLINTYYEEPLKHLVNSSKHINNSPSMYVLANNQLMNIAKIYITLYVARKKEYVWQSTLCAYLITSEFQLLNKLLF